MFVLQVGDSVIVATYKPDRDDNPDAAEAFCATVNEIFGVFAYDFLLDLREAVGPISILTSPVLSQNWRDIARSRDVGRRSAIVTDNPAVMGQVELLRLLYPFRTIAVFETVGDAQDWLASVVDGTLGDFQLI